MDISIEFSFYEINALNKLLGRIKSEPHLDADEMNFFALSPFIVSTFEKVHKKYMDEIRQQQKDGKLKTIGQPINFDAVNDFKLTEDHKAGQWSNRLLDLSHSEKEYLKKMDEKQRQKYCDMFFAPFEPTLKQRQEFLGVLESVIIEENK